VSIGDERLDDQRDGLALSRAECRTIECSRPPRPDLTSSCRQLSVANRSLTAISMATPESDRPSALERASTEAIVPARIVDDRTHLSSRRW
jgi:hypothetical protein